MGSDRLQLRRLPPVCCQAWSACGPETPAAQHPMDSSDEAVLALFLTKSWHTMLMLLTNTNDKQC